MTPLSDTLTQQLRSIRAQKALSIESIAERLGVSPEAYARIENGETDSTLKDLENLARALEVSVPELLSTASTIISHNTISVEAETNANGGGILHSNANYIGVSSEVLEKLFQRIDALESELKASRK